LGGREIENIHPRGIFLPFACFRPDCRGAIAIFVSLLQRACALRYRFCEPCRLQLESPLDDTHVIASSTTTESSIKRSQEAEEEEEENIRNARNRVLHMG
jgi:hypothetical protein